MNSNIKISGKKIAGLTLTLLLSHCQFIHTYAPTTILASQGTDTSLTLTSATNATSTLGTAVITTIPATLAAILNNTGLMYIQAAVSQVISAASNPAISCTLGSVEFCS